MSTPGTVRTESKVMGPLWAKSGSSQLQQLHD